MSHVYRKIGKCVDMYLETKEDSRGSGCAACILCEKGHGEPQDAVC